jgi:Ser-tRNA(Ala) deacylase AlaX
MTDMLYYSYEGNFLMECDAEITQCVFIEDDSSSNSNTADQEPSAPTTTKTKTIQLALNRTVLHAQGGGQPTDRGTIVVVAAGSGDGDTTTMMIQVSKILLDRETQVATHTGTIDAATASIGIAVGDKVKVLVDQDNRLILSECHTAGHVVDAAMAKCGLLPGMETSKAYHL